MHSLDYPHPSDHRHQNRPHRRHTRTTRQLQVPQGDILIHEGDFMSSGERTSEINAFDRWIRQQPYAYKVVIAGNHDCLLETNSGISRMRITKAIYLENSGVELLGLRIRGSPVQPAFNNWASNVERGEAI
jgi:predicted phosphohydrolase